MLINVKLYLQGGGKSLESFKLVRDIIRSAGRKVPLAWGCEDGLRTEVPAGVRGSGAWARAGARC